MMAMDVKASAKYGLAQLQRWMQAVVTNPGGAEAGVEAWSARRELDVGSQDVESVVCRSLALSSLERLDIYASAYFARLLECLRAEFPMFAKAVGEELFDAFAVAYLIEYPSRSYTLGKLGEHFTQFLRETRPDDDDGPSPWPDFLIELADLEWIFNEVFDGPGVEHVKTLDADQLQSIPNERWPQTRITTVPCLRLIELEYAVNHLYSTLREDEPWKSPAQVQTYLAVTRRNYIVRRYEMNRPQYRLLDALHSGRALGTAIEQFAEDGDLDDATACDVLHNWFCDWTAAGFFVGIE